MWSCSGGSSPSGICSASWLRACKSMCPLPRLYRWDSCLTRCKTTCLGRRLKAAQRCRAWAPRLESVALYRGCRASLRMIWKSTAESTTTHTWCMWSRGCWWASLTASTMTASVLSSAWEEALKMVAPVKWCWCSWPAVSVRNSEAAPPGRWGEAPGAGNISKNDGVAVVRAWHAARRRWLVGLDACPLFRGGPQLGGGRLEPSGSVDAHSLAV